MPMQLLRPSLKTGERDFAPAGRVLAVFLAFPASACRIGFGRSTIATLGDEAAQAMSAKDFVASYERALATQDWSAVAPLIHDDASVTFSDGSVHKGKQAVRAAFEANFRTITDERYRISNLHWLLEAEDAAAYLFDFHWTGTIQGRAAEGGGRGTSFLVRHGGRWLLLTEHLGPLPR